jgi:hypothetical protein
MRLNYMRLIEITRTILISFLFLKLTSCDFYSDYHKVVKSEISKGQINNNLILGFSLGMTKQQYYDRCTFLNKNKIITVGGYNFNPEQILTSNTINTKKIKMSIDPSFDENKIIDGMQLRFSFLGWSNWNTDYQSSVLIYQIKDSLNSWLPGNDFIDVNLEGIRDETLVKVDGTRRIVLYKLNSKDVIAKISNLK